MAYVIAAVKKAEEAIIASTQHFSKEEGSGFGVLESEK